MEKYYDDIVTFSELEGFMNVPVKNFSSGMPDLNSILGNAQMMAKLSSIMSAMNKPDHRAELIKALKPLLSEKRRKRADDAMQMLKLFEMLPLLTEMMGGNDKK